MLADTKYGIAKLKSTINLHLKFYYWDWGIAYKTVSEKKFV